MIIKRTIRLFLSVSLAIILIASGCKEKRGAPGSIKGVLEIPAGKRLEKVYIAAMMQGSEKAIAPVNPTTGAYTIVLTEPGVYDLRLKTPIGVLDIASAIEVKSGETSDAGSFPAPVDLFDDAAVVAPSILSTASGNTLNIATEMKPLATEEAQSGVLATVTGEVQPANAEIKLMANGKVVASAKAVGGKFSIPGIAPGLYDVEYSAPGYSTAYHENIAIAAEGALENLNELLLFSTPLDGVDYTKGVVTASGKGLPNPGMTGPQAILMSCRAANVVAMRNLLDAILRLELGPKASVRSLDSDGTVTSELGGFVQGARVVTETKNSDNSCEVTLEVKLYGNTGVTHHLKRIKPK